MGGHPHLGGQFHPLCTEKHSPVRPLRPSESSSRCSEAALSRSRRVLYRQIVWSDELFLFFATSVLFGSFLQTTAGFLRWQLQVLAIEQFLDRRDLNLLELSPRCIERSALGRL